MAGATEIQLIGNAARQKISSISNVQLDWIQCSEIFGLRCNFQEIGVRGGPGEYSHPGCAVSRRVSCIFHGSPRVLQQNSVLGICDLRFSRRYAEECRVKHVNPVHAGNGMNKR